LSKEDKGQMPHTNDEASNFFMVFFSLISIASSLIFTYLYCGVLQNASPTVKTLQETLNLRRKLLK